MESKWRGWALILAVCLGSYQARASPLHECGERPEDWCRDVATAAKCGALELCQITVWDQPLGKGIPCHLCQVVVSVVGKILQDNRTESDPKVVCGTIKLCQPQESPAGALKFQKPPPAPAGPAQDFTDLVAPFIANVPLLLNPQDLPRGEAQEMEEVCGDCLQLVAAAQLELGTNAAFAQALVAHAERACEDLAPDLAHWCKHYLAKYAATATQLLQYMDPQELCGHLGLCSSASALPLHMLLTKKVTQVLSELGDGEGTTPLCEVCQFAVKTAESLLENNVTEEQLVNDIEKVCYMLPHGVIGQCKDFVDSYGKAVVIMLLEATDPAAICTMLHCCPRSGDAGRGAAALEQLAVGAGAFCNVCQIVITYFDNELLKNETLSELGDMLEKGCELLPPPLTGKCEALVVQYEPAAVRLLVQMMDPTFVCTKIRACDSPEEDLLGSDPCAWGPHYWCKNMATAVECHAVEHCRRHLWN
ncbi:unnamed protein product [Bubo scandiacus]